MAQTVTIGKQYFDALLQRANLHSSEPPPDPNTITISRDDHEELLQKAREYDILRNALFRGGINAETLDLLIAGGDQHDDGQTATQHVGGGSPSITFQRPSATPIRMGAPQNGNNGDMPNGHSQSGYSRFGGGYRRESSYGNTPSLDSNDHTRGDAPHAANADAALQPFPRHDQRTLLFTNLADRTTHRDLVDAIRGGRLLDVYVRSDRSATVSFVEGAADFLAYVKRKDLYINSKRVEVRWNDRQFHLPAHVANKISTGATRNIVIRGGQEKTTEAQLRDELEHIHNLVVIYIRFNKGDVYVSTNSVHNALFARTCLMSRSAYKGLKIDWYPDECAAPLPQAQPVQRPVVNPVGQSTARQPSITNRFNMLQLDEDDGSSDDSDQDPLDMGHGVGLSWADTGITA